MLVMLDATVLVADPHCKGIAWRVLANAPADWGIQFVVSEVVLAEAAAGYRRRIDDARAGFERWKDRYGALDLGAAHATVEGELDGLAAVYPERLRETLVELGANIIAPPAVDHMTVVERATLRRRPCNSSGDGYRDTLNWLSLLQCAVEQPQEEIAWVSDNSADFGDDNAETQRLHPELVAELATHNAAERVAWHSTLADLVLTLVAKYAPDLGVDLRRLQEHLHNQALTDFIRRNVLDASAGTAIDPPLCALPTSTLSAFVTSVGEVFRTTVEVRGGLGSDETVAWCQVEAQVDVDYIIPAERGDDVLSNDQTALGASAVLQLTKPLKFSGIVALDSYGRPLGLEPFVITALSDDPGLGPWLNLKRLADRQQERARRPPMPGWTGQTLNRSAVEQAQQFAAGASGPALEQMRQFAAEVGGPAMARIRQNIPRAGLREVHDSAHDNRASDEAARRETDAEAVSDVPSAGGPPDQPSAASESGDGPE